MSAALDPERYPIGGFDWSATPTQTDVESAITTLAELPDRLTEALDGLDDDQLDTPYREGSWTVRQLVHHLADSHLSTFFRVRLALTEDKPAVNGWNEKLFTALPDSAAPPTWSVQMLEAIHARWVYLMQSLTPEQWQRSYVHPKRGELSVQTSALLYAWHSRHHVAHIQRLRSRKGW